MPNTEPSVNHFSLRGKRKVTKRKAALLVGFYCAKIPSLRRDFAGRHDGPSMARPGSIGRPAQSTPKIPPPLGQKMGSCGGETGAGKITVLEPKTLLLPPLSKGRVGVGFIAIS